MYKTIKRVADIIISALLLIMLSPIILIVSLTILILDGKPVIFKQKRIGQYGREFTIYKFRSMRETEKDNNLCSCVNKNEVTKIGKLLRKYKLDELPQLINVLKGDMSFVGSRPYTRNDFKFNEEQELKVLENKPGITGIASFVYKKEEYILKTIPKEDRQAYYVNNILKDKAKLNLEYNDNINMVNDIKIMLATIGVLKEVKLSKCGDKYKVREVEIKNEKRTKKVLFAANLDSFFYKFLIPYLKLFKENGYEVHVAAKGDDYNIPYCDKKFDVCFARTTLTKDNITSYKQMKKIINENNYDIIHCHTPFGAAITRLAAIKVRKKGTRIIYTAHGFHFYEGASLKSWIFFYTGEKILSYVTDDLITINEYDYNIAKTKFNAKRTHLVPGVGVDPNKFNFEFPEEEKQELRKSLGLKKTDFVMIYPAELNENKNQKMLIEVMQKLVKKNKNFKLLLPGMDSLNGKYQEMVKEYKLENNIKFLGYRNDIPKLLKVSNLSVSTSKREGLPLNLLEAMQVGMPIVATNCRGNRDVVEDSNNSCLVKIGDIEDMVNQIIKLSKKKNKTNRNNTKNEKYTLNTVIKEFKKIYDINILPQRVVQVIRAMNVGGAETFIMNLYRNIDKNKVQFDFLVSRDGYFDKEIESMGGKIFKIPYLTDKGEYRYQKNIKKILEENNYKIVHSHIDQVSGTILEAAKKAKVPVRIAHSHNTQNTNGFFGKIYKKYLQSKINKNATHLFGCSEEACKWLFKERANEAVVINNGIDVEKFKYSEEKRKKVRKELGISNDTIVVGHVGAFRKQKNHEGLIDLYNEYLKENPNSCLLLCGEGDLRNLIEEKVKKLGIEDNVKFLGVRSDTDALYSAFDILLFPSLYEGLSVALVEAQASGLKILASDTIDKKTKLTENIEFISLENKNWNEYFVPSEDRGYNKNIDDFDVKKIAMEYQENIEELAK